MTHTNKQTHTKRETDRQQKSADNKNKTIAAMHKHIFLLQLFKFLLLHLKMEMHDLDA